jgi:hypothetical protein
MSAPRSTASIDAFDIGTLPGNARREASTMSEALTTIVQDISCDHFRTELAELRREQW